MSPKAFTTYEIAAHCQVTPRTVIQWVNEGKLKAYRTPGNHSRVELNDFIVFLKKYNMPIPVELISSQKTGRKRILIVDDDEGMVNSIKTFLMRENKYDLDIAYDGFEAGEKYISFNPDLILLDIRMPGIDGYKVCERIRNKSSNKDLKIIFVSATLAEEALVDVQKKGADDFLMKPFSIKDLKSKIEKVLGVENSKPQN